MQSAWVQQVVLPMQVLLAVQILSPVGQAHVPVPAEIVHCSPPTGQSVSTQQPVTHELVPAQYAVGEGQLHAPPGTGHVSPEMVQSAVVQQAVDPMQELLKGQTLLPAAHPHMPPAPEQV